MFGFFKNAASGPGQGPSSPDTWYTQFAFAARNQEAFAMVRKQSSFTAKKSCYYLVLWATSCLY